MFLLFSKICYFCFRKKAINAVQCSRHGVNYVAGAILDSDKDIVTKTGFLYAIARHNEKSKTVGKGIVFSTVLDELDVDDNFKFASRSKSYKLAFNFF